MWRSGWLILVVILFLLLIGDVTAMTTGRGTVLSAVGLLSSIIIVCLPIYFGAYAASQETGSSFDLM